MKKLLLIFSIALIVTPGFSQKIMTKWPGSGINGIKEIKELKEEVSHYVKIAIRTNGYRTHVEVGINSIRTWQFYDPKTKKPMKFETDIQVFNFLYDNGWRMMNILPPNTSSSTKYYLFEKRNESD